MDSEFKPVSDSKNTIEDIQSVVYLILGKWYWLILSLGVAAGSVMLFMRYEQPIYQVNASFITKKFSESAGRVLPTVSESGSFGQRIEVFQQIPILRSEPYIRSTLSRLKFDVSYWVEGRVKLTELYKNEKYVVDYADSSSIVPWNVTFEIDEGKANRFKLYSENEKWNELVSDEDFTFGNVEQVNGWVFKVRKRSGYANGANNMYSFRINSNQSLINQYRNKLNIYWAEKGSAILNVSINGSLPEKDFDFLQTYIDVVVDKGLEDKNEYLFNVIDFIDNYMTDLSDTILQYQNKIDAFTVENRDYIIGSSRIAEKLNALDDKKSALLIENSYYDYLTRYIESKRNESTFAPNLGGVTAPPLTDLFQQYLDEKWSGEIRLNENNDLNPLLLKAVEGDKLIEANVFESIENLKSSNNEKISEINQQAVLLLGSVGDLQVEYRDYLTINRLKTLFEGLYDELLARRADAYISIASNTSDYQEVTAPRINSSPIYPQKNRVIIWAVIFGLVVPIGLIWISDKVNPRIVSKDDLDQHSIMPFLGSLGHYKGEGSMAILESPLSPVSESFRMIRANIEYMNSDSNDNSVIVVTSSISGEGKTFCSVNLAYSYALTNKKTVLVGADMRRPAMSGLFEKKPSFGLSNYLAGQVELQEILFSPDNSNLSVIVGGNIPPNPSELLNTQRMKTFVDELKQKFDVVIFDTPPLGLVSDTQEILKFSTVNILIVRQKVTFKKSLDAVMSIYTEGKLPNSAIVMNDVNFRKYQYGGSYKYGYGYGYGYSGYYQVDKKRNILARLFNKKNAKNN
ncbi:MAG: polysaccharide biosynthesis tyrosine autokinase [Bacteroidota bacterium]